MKKQHYLCYPVATKDLAKAKQKTKLHPFPVIRSFARQPVIMPPQKEPKTISIRCNGVDKEYKTARIVYIEGKNRNTFYYIIGLGMIVGDKITLDYYENLFAASFVRISRQHLVNIVHVLHCDKGLPHNLKVKHFKDANLIVKKPFYKNYKRRCEVSSLRAIAKQSHD